MPHCPVCREPLGAESGTCPRCAGRPAGKADDRVSQQDAWSALVGPRRAQHYLRRFADLSRPGASRVGWHWPAFLAPPLWFLYRKMWGWAAVWVLALPLLLVVDGLLATGSGSFRIGVDVLLLLSLLAAGAVLPALFAEHLYLVHCNRLIRRTARRGLRRRHLARLAARGGTSEAAATAAALFGGIVALGVVAGVVLAVWVDYGKREKVVEALRLGAGARGAVAAFIDRHGTLPADWQDTGFLPPPLPAHVARMDLDPRTGTIAIETQLSKAEAGALRLVPQVDAGERIVWICRADAALEPFSPPSCRGD